MLLNENELSRFMAKISPNRGTGCWEWTAETDRKGYGNVRLRRLFDGLPRAHRISYMHFIGDIPEGMYVCHHCDNPGCVNPDHLFLGTAQDNTDDMINKGRYNPGNRTGERNNSSILTEEKVLEISSLLPQMNNKELAKKYGVTHQMISRIRLGKSWTHLTEIQPRKKYESLRK